MSAVSQANVTVSISNMTYINGTPIANCGNIDFGTNSTVRLQFSVNASKASTQTVGVSNLYVYTLGTSGSRIQRSNVIVQPGSFSTTFSYSADITMNQADFNTTGGTLFAVFRTSSGTEYPTSCNYTVTKTQLPLFTLSPTSTTVDCGSTAAKTFAVTNVYNSPGSLSYAWSFPGWTGTVNNTMASVSLTPSSATTLPGTVTVTPSLNGVAQPTRTATVTRSAFTSSATISGSGTVCSSSTYTMSGLLSGQTVTSWSVSNPSRATLSATSGATTTVTKISNGQVTLTATIRNACNQTVTKAINLQLGGAMDFTWNGVGPFGQLDVNVTSGSSPFKVYRGTTLLYSGSNGSPTVNFGCNGGVLKVEASTPCGTVSKSVIVPSGCASFRGQQTMVVFPNPSSSEINVAQIDEFKEARSDESIGPVTLELYNFNGTLMASQKFERLSIDTKMDISTFKKETYILRIVGKEVDEVHQIVKE
jgi:hypothetical protein